MGTTMTLVLERVNELVEEENVQYIVECILRDEEGVSSTSY
jgi:hypothetical protein